MSSLRAAPPAVQCWTILPDEVPLHFWARRQAHETSIHRADADAAAGRASDFDAQTAVDGIDELLTGFVPRPRTPVHLPEPQTLLVRPSHADAAWRVTIGPDMPTTRRVDNHPPQGATTIPHGRSADLYLLLRNRRDATGIAIEGDRDLVNLWRSSMNVMWS